MENSAVYVVLNGKVVLRDHSFDDPYDYKPLVIAT